CRCGGHRSRDARAAGVRVVPRTQSRGTPALRLFHRRLLRRSRGGGRQCQPGRRVDAGVPPSSVAAGCCWAAARRQGRRAGARGLTKLAPELFRRHPKNPILTAADWPVAVNVVFNPAAVEVGGETVLLVRVEARTGLSHLTVARSANGVDKWRVGLEPLLAPAAGNDGEQWGFEDARV